MEIGSESVKIKSRKLSQMSFHENFTLQNFLTIRVLTCLLGKVTMENVFKESVWMRDTAYT